MSVIITVDLSGKVLWWVRISIFSTLPCRNCRHSYPYKDEILDISTHQNTSPDHIGIQYVIVLVTITYLDIV